MGYEEILKKLDRSIYTDDVIDQPLDSLCAIGEKSKVFYLWWQYLKDPFDDHVLELALASESDYIVTYNKKELPYLIVKSSDAHKTHRTGTRSSGLSSGQAAVFSRYSVCPKYLIGKGIIRHCRLTMHLIP